MSVVIQDPKRTPASLACFGETSVKRGELRDHLDEPRIHITVRLPYLRASACRLVQVTFDTPIYMMYVGPETVEESCCMPEQTARIQ